MTSQFDSLLEEVSEDLRRDRAFALARKYGPYAVALALVAVIAVAGVVGWRHYRATRDLERSTVYATALDAINSGDTAKSESLLEEVTKSSASSGYGTLARLQEAALKAKSGDAAGAAAIYDSLARDSRVDPVFRDLATILYAFASLDTADPAALTARLKPLADGNSPWRASAIEASAYLALRTGDKAHAHDLFAQLADDASAPQEIRSRAAAMASTLGG